jgi:hypothetical protein
MVCIMKLSELIIRLQELPEQLHDADVIFRKDDFEVDNESILAVDEIHVTTNGKAVLLWYLEPEDGEVLGDYGDVEVV